MNFIFRILFLSPEELLLPLVNTIMRIIMMMLMMVVMFMYLNVIHWRWFTQMQTVIPILWFVCMVWMSNTRHRETTMPQVRWQGEVTSYQRHWRMFHSDGRPFLCFRGISFSFSSISLRCISVGDRTKWQRIKWYRQKRYTDKMVETKRYTDKMVWTKRFGQSSKNSLHRF